MLFRRKNTEMTLDAGEPVPQKTGPARFVEILSTECASLFKLNLLFVASCIPVVTIPPAIFAMTHVVRRIVRDEPAQCLAQYRAALRTHWKRGYGAFLLTVLPLCASSYGAWFYLSRAAAQPLLFLPFLLCSTVFLVTLLSSPYFYSLLTTRRSFKECLRLSVILGVGKPLRGLLAAAFVYGSLAASALAFPLSAAYLLLIGFSVPCLLGCFYVRTVLEQLGEA